MKTCIVEGCTNTKIKARGMCSTHYTRWYRHGDVNRVISHLERQAHRKQYHCNVEGCNESHHAKGYCNKHYIRWKKYGDPNTTLVLPPSGLGQRTTKEARLEVIEYLGGKCVRCGFDDVRALQIDHVYDDGYMDRQKRNQRTIMGAILRGEEEGNFQVLCANCNWIKRAELEQDT